MSRETLKRSRNWLLAFSLLGALSFTAAQWSGQTVAQNPAPAAVSQAKQLSKAFRSAAEMAVPTVVKITAHQNARETPRGNRRSRGENPFKGTPFEDYFQGDMQDLLDRQQQPRDGVGSGVIIDSKGVILTNNHVVSGADELIVHLHDGREFKTTDFKVDPETDLAVVRINGAGTLPAAKLGDSDALDTGDWVIAVGHPFELETTVSAGIISGKGRSLDKVKRAKFLQTDAAINPGNSGGPLVNLDGEVVGINTAIASNNGGYQGIGFAVPMNTAKWVVTQLLDTGSVKRAYLGVAIDEVDAALSEKFGVRPGHGVLVTEVYNKTPAAEAGLEAGDLVTEFAGKKVSGPRDLQELVERAPLDSKQSLKVLRDGKSMNMQVVVKALPEEPITRVNRPAGRSEKEETVEDRTTGLEVAELKADVAEKLGYKDQSGVVMSGVVISSVDKNSAAYAAGLREGMLIMKVGKKTVTTPQEFKDAVDAESLKNGILLFVRTANGNNRFIVIRG